MLKRLFLVACCSLCWIPCGHAQHVWEGVEDIVAVGDVHGAYPHLVTLLQNAGLIDADLRWQGGQTHLVSIGDLLDRGPQSRQAMDLLMRLQTEAPASGGRVHVLLGNHELMNLSGDLSEVSEAEHAALADLGGHAAAFASDGKYGQWLLSLPLMIRINDTLFAHAGLPPFLANSELAAANATAQQQLTSLLTEGERMRSEGTIPPATDLLTIANDKLIAAEVGPAFLAAARSNLLGEAGPAWYRGSTSCHALLEEPVVAGVLAAMDAQRVVVGHTPTPNREINSRLNGRVYAIDTGMLAEVYKGKPRLLRINAKGIHALDDRGVVRPITKLPLSDPTEQLSTAAFQAEERVDGIVPLRFADPVSGSFDRNVLPGRFRKLSKRDSQRAVAAYRLDRALGLYMVPATVQRAIDKQRGVVMAWRHRPFTEAERQQTNTPRPNWCAHASDFALLAAFDALIGKTDRSAATLLYERGTLQIRIIENYRAFDTSNKLPQTAMAPVLPQAFAAPLQQLNANELTQLLGELLKPREIQAILKRRDAILQWPVSP